MGTIGATELSSKDNPTSQMAGSCHRSTCKYIELLHSYVDADLFTADPPRMSDHIDFLSWDSFVCTFVAAEHMLPYPNWPICTALVAVVRKGDLKMQICPRSPRHRREGQRLSARNTMFHQADNLSQGSSIDTDSKVTAGVNCQNVGSQTAAGRDHASS